MKINPKLKWIGWILSIPTAIASYFISYAIFNVMTWIGYKLNAGEDGDSWYVKYIVPGIAGGIGGYAFVKVGTLLVPKHKKYVALILLIIVSMTMGIGLFSGILQKHAISIIEAIGSVVGGVIGYIEILEERKITF
ncbi:MAG: hypothetical protein ABI666_04095 [Ferruginibacter sp.]